MRAFYTDHYVLPLPPGHRFPLAKYALLRERVRASGLVAPHDLLEPAAATDVELTRVHEAAYVTRVQGGGLSAAELRRIGFPWSAAMVERSRRSTGATLAACRAALADGVAVNLAGGTHHAYPDHGEGFCVFNDVAVAVRALHAEGLVRRVLIVDCDVHQGNGTAAIFAGDENVFTFDVFAARNYPFAKEPADLSVALDDGTGDSAYLDRLTTDLPKAVERSHADLMIYVSGADPHEGDRLGRLALTTAGLAERDRLVFGTARRAGLPVAVTMAGGYGRDIADTVEVHWATVRAAAGMQ